MFADLFDSPLKIAIIAILILVLFGARKMPEAARSLGKSMRILKTEVQGLHEDEPAASAPVQAAPAQMQAVAPAVDDKQAQLDALTRQLADLQQTVAAKGAAAPDDAAQAQ